jgi:glutamate racemase
MKIGLYDSGLGGLSVLKEFLREFGLCHEYIYLGDSARAPYGSKTKEELLNFMREIFDLMQSFGVDYLISACNTSSMYIHHLDLSKFSFEAMNLFDPMKEFFIKHKFKNEIALLATEANINSKRYLEWDASIYPIKCPKLVPLIENGDLNKAQEEFVNYLSEVPGNIKDIILGCTHYAFLANAEISQVRKSCYSFIDPAKVLISYIKDRTDLYSKFSCGDTKKRPIKIICTGSLKLFQNGVASLLGNEYPVDLKCEPWKQAAP